MPFGGLLTAGAIGAGGSIIGSLFGASAAEKAAQQQAATEQQALQFQEQEYNTQQQNEAPFLAAGQQSVGTLMKDFSNGTFGPGSIPGFTAPTLAQAQATPGYQFTQQQGDTGILAGAAAAGGAVTGGTLKALDTYNTGLADSSYSQIFNQALGTYNAALQGQAQSYSQLAGTAAIGANAAAGLGQTGAAAANTVGNTLSNIGNAQASGTVGGANALVSGITGATNSATLPFYLQQLQATQTNGTGYGQPSSPTLYGSPNYNGNYNPDAGIPTSYPDLSGVG